MWVGPHATIHQGVSSERQLAKARKSNGITYDTAQGACGKVCSRVKFNLSLRCEDPRELRLLPRRHDGGGKLSVKDAVAKLKV